MNYNKSKNKQIIQLNGAGTSSFNPILSGLPIKLRVVFNQTLHNLKVFVGTEDPPTTEITLFQEGIEFFITGIAGQEPFNITESFTNIFFSFTSNKRGKNTIIEKKLFISELPGDAIQVFSSQNREFTNAQSNNILVSQMCGVRFFNSWFDEFNNKNFGGVKYVSVFDADDTEDGTQQLYVRRQTEINIRQLNNINLTKHEIATIEQHNVKFLLKSKRGGEGVEVPINLKSVSCWGFELLDPITS